MSRSYWLPIIAAVGLILAFGTIPLWLAVEQCRYSGPNSQIYAAQRTTKPKAAHPDPMGLSIQRNLQRIANALDAANEKPPSEYEKRNAQSQEYMACWTPWIFRVALAEMLITLTGVVLVVFTLKYTRDLFEDQRIATQAAKDAVETSRAEVAAYVTITEAMVYHATVVAPAQMYGQLLTNVKIRASNSGQTPARTFRWSPTLQYLAFDPETWDQASKIVGRQRTVDFDWRVSIGETIPGNETGEWHLGIPGMVMDSFVAGLDEQLERFCVRLQIEFEYTDVFKNKVCGEAYFAGFANLVRPNPGGGSGGWNLTLVPSTKPGDWDGSPYLSYQD